MVSFCSPVLRTRERLSKREREGVRKRQRGGVRKRERENECTYFTGHCFKLPPVGKIFGSLRNVRIYEDKSLFLSK
jgi:hypothetical protein